MTDAESLRRLYFVRHGDPLLRAASSDTRPSLIAM